MRLDLGPVLLGDLLRLGGSFGIVYVILADDAELRFRFHRLRHSTTSLHQRADLSFSVERLPSWNDEASWQHSDSHRCSPRASSRSCPSGPDGRCASPSTTLCRF